MRCLRLLAVGLALSVLGCADNALQFRNDVERAVSRLADAGVVGATVPIVYVPVASTKPYWLILFPDRTTTLDELVSKGVPAPVAQQIFEDLAYVNVGQGDIVVVWQEGERLSFQNYHGRTPVRIEDLTVIRGSGETALNLQKTQDGEYRLSVPSN